LAPPRPIPRGERMSSGETLADDASTVTFASAARGSLGSVESFLVHNDGSAPLSLGAVTLATGFTLLEAPNATVAPGGSATFVVRMDTEIESTPAGELSVNAAGVAGGVVHMYGA